MARTIIDLEGDDMPTPPKRPDIKFLKQGPAMIEPQDNRELPPTTDHRLPASPEAEAHVIACCLLDEGATLDRATEQGVREESFSNPANRVIFRALVHMREHGKHVSLEVLGEELKSHRRLEMIGGWSRLMELTGRIETTAHAGYMIEQLISKQTARQIIRFADSTRELALNSNNGDTERLVASMQEQVDAMATQKAIAAKIRPISSYAYPQDDDPNTLLGNDDYLGRGGGMLFVSHAGAGKSSWIMDACMMWSLGRAWMQIKCNGQLKVLIIQAEDSDRYIGKIFTSFAFVNNLSTEELALLKRNCLITRLKGVSGAAFLATLKRLTTEHKPDLVVINPVYLYAEGDIGRSEFAQPFLVGLDRVNRDEKFAYILIHHTGKPAKQKDGKKAELDDWESAYQGFGSSYFANWPRCTALLEPIAGDPGKFQIKLGKGGMNAGITRQVEQGAGFRTEPVTRLAIRHSTLRMPVGAKDKPVYYWEMDPTDRESPDYADKRKNNGPAAKYSFDDYRNVFPSHQSEGLVLAQLHRLLIGNKAIKVGTLHAALKRWQQENLIEILEPKDQPMRYRMAF